MVVAGFLLVVILAYRLAPVREEKNAPPVAAEKEVLNSNEPITPAILKDEPVPADKPIVNAGVLSVPPAIPEVVPSPTPAPSSQPKPEVKPPTQPVPVQAAGRCAVPAGAGAESIANPTTVVGDGTKESCTAAKVVEAVGKGGVVTFNCGPEALVIKVPEIKIFNNGGKGDGSVTIDGGNKITLAPVGDNRIIYQNTCDQSLVWTSPRCDIQSAPHLALQNIAFSGGRGAAGKGSLHDVLGGGAIYVRGGTFKAYNVKITGSVQTNATGVSTQDLAGGAIYTFGLAKPATIVNSYFEGNSAANGGAIGGLFTSYTVVNTTFKNNQTTGHGMNPARAGTTGGGLGGAIYNDGNNYALDICGTKFIGNSANELGSGSIFMVANDLRGKLEIAKSVFEGNSNNGSVQKLSGIYVEAQDKRGVAGVDVSDTTGL